jgi:deoxyribodipyrimidine photo-lyase
MNWPKKQDVQKYHYKKLFKKWCDGETGFPIIDAGMRQLNITGYMHNRARLIVASVLVKTLLIDWTKGEKFFATHLTDYDPANNNGNWEWIMGGGADSQPYFRVFNPWLQSKEYDSDALYIKKWIPELSEVPARSIHKWYSDYNLFKYIDYPSPIVNYNEQKKRVIDMYKRAFN